jgi:hypothetical protein
MMRWGWERLAALAGIVAVVLWIVSVVVTESTNLPDDNNPLAILAWFRLESNAILASAFLFMLGSLFFLIFVGALRSRLVAFEGQGAFLTAIAFAGGLGVGFFTLMVPGPNLAGALAEEDLTPQAAQALVIVDDAFFIGAELSAALMLAAAAFAILQYGALPRWLAWVGLLFALWLLIPPIGWAGLLLGVPLWTLAAAVLMWMRPSGDVGSGRGPSEPPAPTPQPPG